MKKSLLAAVVTAILSSTSHATPIDVIGGPDGTTQTIHQCGYLAATDKSYTTSPATISLIEHKLIALGYSKASPNGVYNKADKRAVKQFQNDYGLKADGIVGPLTAKQLAYVSHPSSHVRNCTRVVSSL